MGKELEIVISNGEYRVDSRLVAQGIGIQHDNLMQTISKYQRRLEKYGILLFETGKIKGRGRPEQYVLLNKEQFGYLLMFVRVTDVVRDYREQVYEKFLAYEHMQQTTPAINALWEKRALLFNEKTRIPEGYWCVFNEIAHVCWGMEFRGEHLQEDAVPDISVGLLWMKEVRRLSLPELLIQSYPHHYPDRRGVRFANIYPNAWLGAFRDWFHQHYLQHEFRAYVQKHALLLSPPEHKHLL